MNFRKVYSVTAGLSFTVKENKLSPAVTQLFFIMALY